MNGWNSEEEGSVEYESEVFSSEPNDPAALPEVLDVLGHRTNRRILCHLLSHGGELSVDELAKHLVDERQPPETHGLVSVADRNGGEPDHD